MSLEDPGFNRLAAALRVMETRLTYANGLWEAGNAEIVEEQLVQFVHDCESLAKETRLALVRVQAGMEGT